MSLYHFSHPNKEVVRNSANECCLCTLLSSLCGIHKAIVTAALFESAKEGESLAALILAVSGSLNNRDGRSILYRTARKWLIRSVAQARNQSVKTRMVMEARGSFTPRIGLYGVTSWRRESMSLMSGCWLP